jgi:hypothetical protein
MSGELSSRSTTSSAAHEVTGLAGESCNAGLIRHRLPVMSSCLCKNLEGAVAPL